MFTEKVNRPDDETRYKEAAEYLEFRDKLPTLRRINGRGPITTDEVERLALVSVSELLSDEGPVASSISSYGSKLRTEVAMLPDWLIAEVLEHELDVWNKGDLPMYRRARIEVFEGAEELLGVLCGSQIVAEALCLPLDHSDRNEILEERDMTADTAAYERLTA
jgi:hypothetical protein